MTPEKLALILLARIAGEPSPEAYVDAQLAAPVPGPGAADVTGHHREVDPDGTAREFELLGNGARRAKT